MELGFLGVLPHIMFAAGLVTGAVLFVGQLRALRRHWIASAVP